MVIVTVTPVVKWWATALAGPWYDPRGEILILLAGSTTDGDIIGRSSYWRAAYALHAYEHGACRRIFVTGGGPRGVPAAELMRTFLIAGGVPAEAIRTETESRDTWESAQNSKRLLASEPGDKILLTSDYHMFRAHRMFSKAGLETLPRPIPDARKRAVQWHLRWWVFLDLLRESASIVYHWAHHRI